MKVGYKKILFIEILFFVALFFCNFVLKMTNSYLPLILICLGIFILNLIFFGFERERFRYKKDIIMTVVIYSVVFLILTYIASFFVGYLKSSYSLTFVNIVKNVVPVLTIIILSELIRYSLITKSKGFTLGIVLATIVMIFVDIYFLIPDLTSDSVKTVVENICSGILPSIFKNILLTYLTYNVGYKPTIIYRIIFEATKFILPIFPGYGVYIQAVLDVIFPFVLLIKIRNMLEIVKNKKLDVRETSIVSRVLTIILCIIMVITIFFTSGLFKYYSVAVASNSMAKKINRGDVVIVKKYSQGEVGKIEDGEILFFENNEKLVLHRVIEKTYENNTYYFQTKGDNNKKKDDFVVSQKEVVGKVVFVIPYIGWPSVWLSELVG